MLIYANLLKISEDSRDPRLDIPLRPVELRALLGVEGQDVGLHFFEIVAAQGEAGEDQRAEQHSAAGNQSDKRLDPPDGAARLVQENLPLIRFTRDEVRCLQNVGQQCERHRVRFQWVKGHAGNTENERCDTLSIQAATGKNLPPDEIYEQTQGRPAANRLF